MREQTKTIHVFPRPKWVDQISCDGKPCQGETGCDSGASRGAACQSPGCGDAETCDLAVLLDKFARTRGDEITVKVADYSSSASIQASLVELNRILELNREDLRVTLDNFELVFSQAAPIFAVDDALAFVGRMSGESELLRALKTRPR